MYCHGYGCCVQNRSCPGVHDRQTGRHPRSLIRFRRGGLGACNLVDQPACAGPAKAIDNPGFDDGALLTFDPPIAALTIELNGHIDGALQDTDAMVLFGLDQFDCSTHFTSRIDSIGSGSRIGTVPLATPVM